MSPATEAQRAELEALYAQVPTMHCIGKCVKACAKVDASPVEHGLILERGFDVGRDHRLKQQWRPASCPALTMFGQCAVYDIRPMVCRIWGAMRGLECAYCRPPDGWLPYVDGMILLVRALRVGADAKTQRQVDQFVAALRNDPALGRQLHAELSITANADSVGPGLLAMLDDQRRVPLHRRSKGR